MIPTHRIKDMDSIANFALQYRIDDHDLPATYRCDLQLIIWPDLLPLRWSQRHGICLRCKYL